MTSQAKEDLQALLALIPARVRQRIEENGNEETLLEVVMDLGRRPSARYVAGEQALSDNEITREEIDMVVNGIGDFDDDNRAGITRTLHRIAGIRNRRGQVVGLTCRVGRAVYGTANIIADIVKEGCSILLLGRPGVGKTTMLREMARILAEEKRVIIVDTSNEIGGDGDIPHPAVGSARRMQVPRPSHQDETMIEAVENHNPEVIIIDEIGREREAAAARTINERGVQLIGTAHGNSLENILLNPTLSDLIGGIESVTLSDDEARRRGTQKTVLERRAPPTFDVLIEIQERQLLLVHPDVTSSVDAMLRGMPFDVELRQRDEAGEVKSESLEILVESTAVTGKRDNSGRGKREISAGKQGKQKSARQANDRVQSASSETPPIEPEPKRLNVYAYGVSRNRLKGTAKRMGVGITLVDHIEDAEALVTLKSYYRKQRHLITDAERRRVPVYVLRANTTTQMENFLGQAFGLSTAPDDPFEDAMAEAETAVRQALAGQPGVNLRPANAAIRRYQHQVAKQAGLVSHSYGKEPRRYVRIYNAKR